MGGEQIGNGEEGVGVGGGGVSGRENCKKEIAATARISALCQLSRSETPHIDGERGRGFGGQGDSVLMSYWEIQMQAYSLILHYSLGGGGGAVRVFPWLHIGGKGLLPVSPQCVLCFRVFDQNCSLGVWGSLLAPSVLWLGVFCVSTGSSVCIFSCSHAGVGVGRGRGWHMLVAPPPRPLPGKFPRAHRHSVELHCVRGRADSGGGGAVMIRRPPDTTLALLQITVTVAVGGRGKPTAVPGAHVGATPPPGWRSPVAIAAWEPSRLLLHGAGAPIGLALLCVVFTALHRLDRHTLFVLQGRGAQPRTALLPTE
eukprot:Hpha_TRINITY_DN15988_c2_g6::TRINITY_DN15988_c2_g6_i2::g.70440::m.70440